MGVADPIGAELEIDRQMGEPVDQHGDPALGVPGQGKEDLVDPPRAGALEQILEIATGLDASGGATVRGVLEHPDQVNVGVLLGAQQVEEAGAGALVAAHDRDAPRGELSDRARLPQPARDERMEQGEHRGAEDEPKQQRALGLAPGGPPRPGEQDQDDERAGKAGKQLAQRSAEGLQSAQIDVRDQDAQHDEQRRDEAADHEVGASFELALGVDFHKGWVEQRAEEAQCAAVGDDHEVGDDARRGPCPDPATRPGGGRQWVDVRHEQGGFALDEGDHAATSSEDTLGRSRSTLQRF
jgi:hypothetical protein